MFFFPIILHDIFNLALLSEKWNQSACLSPFLCFYVLTPIMNKTLGLFIAYIYIYIYIYVYHHVMPLARINIYIYIYIYIHIHTHTRLIGQVGGVFVNDPGDWGSIPSRVIPKDSKKKKKKKMVLDPSLLNIQHYKVCIEGKVEQSRRSSTFPYTSV